VIVRVCDVWSLLSSDDQLSRVCVCSTCH